MQNSFIENKWINQNFFTQLQDVSAWRETWLGRTRDWSWRWEGPQQEVVNGPLLHGLFTCICAEPPKHRGQSSTYVYALRLFTVRALGCLVSLETLLIRTQMKDLNRKGSQTRQQVQNSYQYVFILFLDKEFSLFPGSHLEMGCLSATKKKFKSKVLFYI